MTKLYNRRGQKVLSEDMERSATNPSRARSRKPVCVEVSIASRSFWTSRSTNALLPINADQRSHIELWEEAFPLGYTGSVLTLLSLKA